MATTMENDFQGESPNLKTPIDKNLSFQAAQVLIDPTKDRYLAEKKTDDTHPDSSYLQAHYNLAKIFYDKSDLLRAKENFELALSFSELPRDIFKVFKTYGFLIRLASETMDLPKVEKYIKLSAELLGEFPKLLKVLTAEYFYNAGLIQTYQGHLGEALKNFELAYHKSKEENDQELLIKSLYALAQSASHHKNFSLAMTYLEELKEILPHLDKIYLLGSMHLLMGNIYSEIEKYDRALHHYKEANKAFKHKTCWNLYGYLLLGYGMVHKKQGEFKKAEFYFELAQNSVDSEVFKRLTHLLKNEMDDVTDNSVDLYLDRTNRIIHEKMLGTIDFKHRFVLLEILFLLASNAGTYFNKEELAMSIWKDEYNPLIHDKLIYTSVSRLRKLIEPVGEKRVYILRGKDGYTFNPHVKTRFQGAADFKGPTPFAHIEINCPV